MIPNSAPMAAVFLRLDKPVTFSLPVVGWSEDLTPLVPHDKSLLDLGDTALPDAEFMGIWPQGWTPSYDQRMSLLPPPVPGTPHPLAVRVTVREIPGGWAAFRSADDHRIVEAVTYDLLEHRLSMLGNFLVESVVQAESDEE